MNRRFLLTGFTVVMTSLAVVVGAGWTGITPSSAAISGQREKASELEGFEPIAWLGGVHFDFNKANIRPADAKILDRDVEWLKANSNVKVAIDGGADQRGPIAYKLHTIRSSVNGGPGR